MESAERLAVPTVAADLTDRERLALAFDDLAQQGYLAPVDFAWTVCCNSCGVQAIAQMAETSVLQNPAGYLFWHQQKDGASFYPNGEEAMPLGVARALMDCGLGNADADTIGAWLDEHDRFVQSCVLEERMRLYARLLQPLHLHWGGDPELICSTLERWGFSVRRPTNTKFCIVVLPRVDSPTVTH